MDEVQRIVSTCICILEAPGLNFRVLEEIFNLFLLFTFHSFYIAIQSSIVYFIKLHLNGGQVRKMAYVQGNSVPSANIGVLDKLIGTRHEIAQVKFVFIYCFVLFLINCILLQDISNPVSDGLM